jgi:hypothetical protein
MTPKEIFQESEARLDTVSRALLDPRPEILDYCEGQLQEVIESLESAGSSGAAAGAEERAELVAFHRKLRLLAMQTQNAVNLCQGWTQLGLSQGYTDQGKPVPPLTEPQIGYEV